MTESTEKPGAIVRVLLVDDQRFVAEAVRRMLASAEDVLLEWCGQGAAAVERATAFSPTVILQDLVMPDAAGLDVVTALRANPATHDVPIIVLSSREEPAVKAEAFARGANDYLVKLPDAIEVLARIRYHSAGCLAARQLAATHAALKASQTRHRIMPTKPISNQPLMRCQRLRGAARLYMKASSSHAGSTDDSGSRPLVALEVVSK